MKELLRIAVKCLIWLMAVTCAVGSSLVAESSHVALDVVPQPQQVEIKGAGFRPVATTMIRVTDDPADRFAADLLTQALRGTHGIDPPIVTQSQTNGPHLLWLGDRNAPPPSPALPPALSAEGYVLWVEKDGVTILARDDAGFFYGVQTLIQLLEQSRREKADIQGMRITDWPTFGWRARYFDASQYLGTIVMTRTELEREIKLLARFKLNWLCFDAYNVVPFKSFPACADANTLSL